jgi:autotransporter-associated beta strand protein
VGWLGTNNNPTLSYSYASNSVSGPALSNSSGSGALVGLISTSGGSFTLTSNYYDSSKSGQSRGIGGSGNGNSPNYYAVYADATNQVSALTTGQLKTASNLPGFTFGSAGFGYAGSINGGLPVICTLSSCTSFITSVVSATYNGLSGGLWSVGTNWIGGIAPVAGSSVTEAVINSGSSVSYDTATVGSLGFDIQNAGSITFTGMSDVTLSGLISGAGSLTLAGTGRVTLSGANTYSAGTTVSAGVLQAGSATAFGTGAI